MMTKLEKMLTYVSEHNEFYKNIIRDYNIKNPLDITLYPILTRQQLQENRYNMFSDGYKSKYYAQQLRRQTSSGSSGVPINVYWDSVELTRSNLALWRLRSQYYDITPKARKVIFTLAAYNSNRTTDCMYFTRIGDNTLSFNVPSIQNNQKFLETLQVINQFKPEWLYIQPSVLMQLMRYYKEYIIAPPKSLRYIESVGELLPKVFQAEAASFFKVPIANMYGSEEHNGIAIECPFAHMHIISDNVKVEVNSHGKTLNYGEGEAIITNLNNQSMPLIRYNQGDIIRINKEKIICPCGNHSPIIDVIKGRQYEIIYENGHQISALLLSEIVSEVQNQYNDPISKFLFIYKKTNNNLTLYVTIRPQSIKWKNVIYTALYNTFLSRITYDSSLNFNVCDFTCRKSEKDIFNQKWKILNIEE